MSAQTMDPAGRVLTDARAYSDEKRLYAALAHLRANAPLCCVE